MADVVRTNTEMTITEMMEKLTKLESLIDSLHDLVFEADVRGQLCYANQCIYEFFKYPASPTLDFARINVLEWITPGERQQGEERMAVLLAGQEPSIFEYTLQRQDGTIFPAMIHTFPLVQDGQLTGFRGVVMDVSQRQSLDDRIKYMSVHDTLTGLYNRSYFDFKMNFYHEEAESPHGLIVCDLDGLKLINDTLGHEAGDNMLMETAAVMKSCFRQSDIVARLGGDEFAIILPHCNEQATINSFHRLQEAVNHHNQTQLVRLPLLISMGYAVSSEKSVGLKALFARLTTICTGIRSAAVPIPAASCWKACSR